MQLFYKLNNGNKVYYNLKENNEVDMSIIIQKLVILQEKMYDELIDSVDASYEICNIIDELIDIKD